MNVIWNIWRSFCTLAVRVVTEHGRRSLVLGALLLALSIISTFLAANIANYLDSAPSPLDDLLAATFHCYPSFLHHPDPYPVLGIPSPPNFGKVPRQSVASGIGDFVYDDPKLLRTARRRLAKCWHSDKARLHPGLSTRDLELLNRDDGIFDDALDRALRLASKCRGEYPAFVLPSLKLDTSKLSLNSMGLTFLSEASKEDPMLAQQLSDQASTFAFKPAKDCPPCTPEFLLQELLEAAFTPPWSLPPQPNTWRHVPKTCAACTWTKIGRSYTHFFGNWDVSWRTFSLNLTSLEQASLDGRLPPPGRMHEFWWRKDLDPPKFDGRGRIPSQRRIAFDLFCKYARLSAKILLRRVFGVHVMGSQGNTYTDPTGVSSHHLLDWQDVPTDDGKDYPRVIHLFSEQLAKYGRNTTVWQPTRRYFKCWDECQAARDSWEQEHRK